MERYGYTKVSDDTDGVYILTTEPEEMNLMITEMKKSYPKVLISEVGKLQSGEVYYVRLSGVSSKDSGKWWLIRQLCSHGWEPLGAASMVYGNSQQTHTSLHYEFKRTNSS